MVTVAASEELLKAVFSYLIVMVEACGGLVIAVGVGRAIVEYVRTCCVGRKSRDHTGLRITLGRSMVLALEFQVAADILKTGLSPTWQDILLLSAIIALRTVLNILMERELEFLNPDPSVLTGESVGDD
jgi:uncharacterized membrane protein